MGARAGAILWIALRYALSAGRGTKLRLISTVSVVAMAMGVASLIMTLAMLEGFQSSIRERLVSSGPHALILPAKGRYMHKPEPIAAAIKSLMPDCMVRGRLSSTAIAVSRGRSTPAKVIGSAQEKHVAVNRALAAQLALGPGSKLTLLSPKLKVTPLGRLPTVMVVPIDEVKELSISSPLPSVSMPLQKATRLLGEKPGSVSSLEVLCPKSPWDAGERVRAALAGFNGSVDVRGLKRLNRALLSALALERLTISGAVSLMLLIAATNLLANVASMASYKSRSLAVLYSLGFTRKELMVTFICVSLLLGLAGATAGAAIGWLGSELLDTTGAIPLPSGLAAASVPFRVKGFHVAAVLAAAVLLSALAGLIPARAAVSKPPSEELRRA